MVNASTWMPPKPNRVRQFTVTGIVLHEDRVLLIEHRKAGLFLCPGGHVEPNEDPVTALHREVAEETGIQVDILAEHRFHHPAVSTLPAPFCVMVAEIPARPSEPAHEHIDFVYAVRPTSTEVSIQPAEVASYRWVRVAEVANLPTPPEYPNLVAAVAEYARALG